MKKLLYLIMPIFLLGLVINVDAATTCEYERKTQGGVGFKVVVGTKDGYPVISGIPVEAGSAYDYFRTTGKCVRGDIYFVPIYVSGEANALYLNCGSSGSCLPGTIVYKYISEYQSDDSGDKSNSGGGSGKSFGESLLHPSWANGILGTDKCPAIFGSGSDPNSLLYILKEYIFKPIRFLVPVILILLTSIDFAKVVFNDNKDGMNKAKSNFVKRTVAAILIFLAPTIVSALLTLIDSAQVNGCVNSNNNIIDKL